MYLIDSKEDTSFKNLAEEEGFEPPDEFPRQRFSRPPPSTTRPFLHFHRTFAGMVGARWLRRQRRVLRSA